MPSADETFTTPAEEARRRIGRLFEFLRALEERRNPIVFDLKDLPWHLQLAGLPEHPDVKLARCSDMAALAEPTPFLRVKRPDLNTAPPPPLVLRQWLKPGWEQPDGPLETFERITRVQEDGSEFEEDIGDDDRRIEAFVGYSELHQRWQASEIVARRAYELYEKLYGLWGDLQREGDARELLLANATLSVDADGSRVQHPLLLARVQLEFDPNTPELRILDSGQPPEFFHSVFRRLPGVPGQTQDTIRKAFENEPMHPLEDLFRVRQWCCRTAQWLHPQGSTGTSLPDQVSGVPNVAETPFLLARRRAQGFVAALDSIVEVINGCPELPPVLKSIFMQHETPPSQEREVASGPLVQHCVDPLFALPANETQREIAVCLENRTGVVVQGPPGTGKTHTIANLLGHFLAQGKSVLVTSHTSKALRVLRDKLPEQIRPLCVSVLENDLASRDELKHSVNEIAARASGLSTERDRTSRDLHWNEMARHRENLHDLREELSKARSDEYRQLIIGGQAIEPAAAARRVFEGRAEHSWIPTPVELGVPLPLGHDELVELYSYNSISPNDEMEVGRGVPPPGNVMTPERLEAIVVGLESLIARPNPHRPYWTRGLPDPAAVDDLRETVGLALSHLDLEDWLLYVVHDSFEPLSLETWNTLLNLIHEYLDACLAFRESALALAPQLPETNLDTQIDILEQILIHTKSGKPLGGALFKFTHRDWSRFLETVTVNGKAPGRHSEVEVLLDKARLERRRLNLLKRWDRQVTTIGGPSPEQLGGSPEAAFRQFAERISEASRWRDDHWVRVEMKLAAIGFNLKSCLAALAPNLEARGELLRLREAMRNVILPALEDASREHQRLSLEQEIALVLQGLQESGCQADIVRSVIHSLQMKDVQGYAEHWMHLRVLQSISTTLGRKALLLGRLKLAAPGWAQAIQERSGVHGDSTVPGEPQAAWTWRQLHDELEVRAARSMSHLQNAIKAEEEGLQRATANYISAASWVNQYDRMQGRPTTKQRLSQWMQAVNNSTGVGRDAIRLRMDLPRLMARCIEEVPVWIMPLNRVVETFDPSITTFDVVIIDEASQSNLLGLIPMYFAKTVVVVGDDEQVSPDAVGEDTSEVLALRETYLRDFPERNLFAPTYSLYDFATAHFGSPIRLRDHFRCAPEIIQFSNALSYQFEIQPLRDMSKCLRRPHIIAHRVQGIRDERKRNIAEAQEIASLIAAMCEVREYDGASIGVISLLGDEQARLIDKLLRDKRVLSEREYKGRKIVCGNAYQFQGDERDVMFLSMVESADDGRPPHLIAGGARDMWKKRYNVAASRARDQMWVVHSIDTQVLQATDLRRRLLEHAVRPNDLMGRLNEASLRTESEFERRVAQLLIANNFIVKPQWQVGAYRIDLVVEGQGRRLAVECDGDRYHHFTDEQAQRDSQRQEILERLGWTFERIRGSVFFRDQERAMKPVWAKLRDMHIEPTPAMEGEVVDSELRNRVVRIATEKRRGWRDEGDILKAFYRARIPRKARALGDGLSDRHHMDATAEATDVSPGRRISDVPSQEIQTAFEASLSLGPLLQDQLFQAVKEALGFQRLKKRIKERLFNEMEVALRTGRLCRRGEDGALSNRTEQGTA